MDTGIRIAAQSKRPAPPGRVFNRFFGVIEAMNSLKDALDEAIPRAVNNQKKPM